MAALLLITLVLMGLYHWLLAPLIQLGTVLFAAGWLAWLLVLGLLWLFLAPHPDA